MKWKEYLRGAVTGALCLLLCAAGLVRPAQAVTAKRSIPDFKTDAECSVTLRYAHDGVKVALYKVADMVNANARFELVDGFAQLNDKTGRFNPNKQKNASDWRNLARALRDEVEKEENAGLTFWSLTGTTKNGVVQFSGLKPGLYLAVMVESYRYKEYNYSTGLYMDMVYTVDPYLVSLPTWDDSQNNNQGGWIYQVSGDVSKKATVGQAREVNIQAVKLWRNSSGALLYNHPNTVTVALRRNGVILYSTQRVLSSGNGWTCSWEHLNNWDNWSVAEIGGSQNFVLHINSDRENVFQLTNTLVDTPTSQPPVYTNPPTSRPPVYTNPPTSGQPSDVELEDPDTPLGPPPIDSSDPPPSEIELEDPDIPLGDLPQTGQLWWPVPFLVVAGMFLVLIGLIRRRGADYDEE